LVSIWRTALSLRNFNCECERVLNFRPPTALNDHYGHRTCPNRNGGVGGFGHLNGGHVKGSSSVQSEGFALVSRGVYFHNSLRRPFGYVEITVRIEEVSRIAQPCGERGCCIRPDVVADDSAPAEVIQDVEVVIRAP